MIVKEWVVLFVVSKCLGGKRPHRDVKTVHGQVRGYLYPDPPHHVFLGIPYARAPLLHHRFKAPEPTVPWDGIFEATHRVKCPQVEETGVENCLVVNVFAPEQQRSIKPLPVIVHVHDGDFQRGWGSYRAPSRLLKENFVIVTFNYRLGVLGFLCLGSFEAQGNAGLKDQVAALYWVQRNIKNFGGNPTDITIYGTGSGAVAVELLLLSGTTTGLFQRMILESGSAIAPSSVTYTPFSTAVKVAAFLGYNGEAKANKLADFYQQLSIRSLKNVTEMFLPCIEHDQSNTNSLLDVDPLDILKDAHFFHVPIIMAFSNAFEVKIISDNIKRFTFVPANFNELLPSNLEFESEDLRTKLAKLVKEFYFGDNMVGDNLIPNYVDYVNDIFIEYPVVKSSILHARATQPVYLLKFMYKGSMSSVKSEEIQGAGHGDLYMYIFSNEQLNSEEQVISDRLIQLISNFIKVGDPTPLTTTLIPAIWEPVPYTNDLEGKITVVPYLLFDKTVANQLLSGQQLIFWDHIYTKFYKKHENS